MVVPYVVNDFWDVVRRAANCHGACSHSPRVGAFNLNFVNLYLCAWRYIAQTVQRNGAKSLGCVFQYLSLYDI